MPQEFNEPRTKSDITVDDQHIPTTDFSISRLQHRRAPSETTRNTVSGNANPRLRIMSTIL